MSNDELPIILPWDFEDQISDIFSFAIISTTSLMLEQILLEPFFDSSLEIEIQENQNAENPPQRNQ